jgi:hypothetical protein
MYNVALGLCNQTASANNRIHEWYKDSISLYGLWISDNTGAATPWIRVTGGQAAGTTAIDFTTVNSGGGATFNVGTNGVTINSTGGSSGSITIQDTGAAGCNIRMIGDGATTPKKFLRVTGGAFQIINDVYSAQIIGITDAGVITDIRGLPVARDAGTTVTTPPVGSILIAAFAGGTNISALATTTAGFTIFASAAGANGTIAAGSTWRNLGAISSSSTVCLVIRTA